MANIKTILKEVEFYKDPKISSCYGCLYNDKSLCLKPQAELRACSDFPTNKFWIFVPLSAILKEL